MNELQFYTTLKLGWLNAWIPISALILVQLIFMFVFKEGGKRAVDTSWYKPKDKFYAIISSILQVAIVLVSLFIPLKSNMVCFIAGCLIFVISFVSSVAAFYAYGKTPRGETVRNGIYRLSRNPMYLSFSLGVIATCIATASLWLLILSIPFMLAMHGIILGEERYCTETYGDEYLNYKKQVARYFGRKRTSDF